MGIYTKLINEAFLFKSKEAKEISKKIKEICKNSKVDKPLLDKLSKKFDNKIKLDTIQNFKKYFDDFHEGTLMEEITTDNYGAKKISYFCLCTGMKNNIIMQFKLYLCSYKCFPSDIKEIGKVEDLIIPQDVIKQSFKLIDDGVDLIISKNKIRISPNGSIDSLSEYAEKHYPNNIKKSKSDYTNTSYLKNNENIKLIQIVFN